MSTACEGKEAQINKEFHTMEEEITHLSEKVSELEGCLSQVIHPCAPERTSKEEKEQVVLVPMAERIRQYRLGIHQQVSQIKSILDRLEI